MKPSLQRSERTGVSASEGGNARDELDVASSAGQARRLDEWTDPSWKLMSNSLSPWRISTGSGSGQTVSIRLRSSWRRVEMGQGEGGTHGRGPRCPSCSLAAAARLHGTTRLVSLWRGRLEVTMALTL